MALETFNFLDSLVPDNPVVSDGLVNGDDHIRGIKLALKNTFPALTGAVTVTQDAINTAAGWATSGVPTLKGAGVYFNANPTDGFKNTLAGDIDVVLQGTVAATFQQTLGVNTFKVTGGITATGEIKGPGITPIGAAVMWFEDTLPTDGLWVWANGQVIANANTVAPVLLARWGNRFGGNGTTTMGVPDMQEVVPVGKSGMGGATAPGLLTSIATGVKDVLLSLFGVDTVTLTTAQMPSHFHSAGIYDPQHSHPVIVPSNSGNTGGGGAFGNLPTSGNTSAAATGVRVNSSNGLDTTYSAGGGASHTNLGPRKVVCWIIRIG